MLKKINKKAKSFNYSIKKFFLENRLKRLLRTLNSDDIKKRIDSANKLYSFANKYGLEKKVGEELLKALYSNNKKDAHFWLITELPIDQQKVIEVLLFNYKEPYKDIVLSSLELKEPLGKLISYLLGSDQQIELTKNLLIELKPFLYEKPLNNKQAKIRLIDLIIDNYRDEFLDFLLDLTKDNELEPYIIESLNSLVGKRLSQKQFSAIYFRYLFNKFSS